MLYQLPADDKPRRAIWTAVVGDSGAPGRREVKSGSPAQRVTPSAAFASEGSAYAVALEMRTLTARSGACRRLHSARFPTSPRCLGAALGRSPRHPPEPVRPARPAPFRAVLLDAIPRRRQRQPV